MLPSGIELILASKSPRRSQLLEMAGIPFTIKTKEVEEIYPEDLPALEVAPYLAQLKAKACQDFLQTDQQVLLTADSVVVLDDVIYGKPRDKAHAQQILRRLSGRVHTVVTGICLKSKQRELVRAAHAQVHFQHLTDTEIDYYLDRYQPYDKAGSYAIQEWIGLCKVRRIEGTYDNIMGLPVSLVYESLSDGDWGL
ncbi:MAG: Maf family nucleotide pyrophosphatase [Bacteroidota bacterium]